MANAVLLEDRADPPALRLVIGVPTKGCRWIRSEAGCVHCPSNAVIKMHPPVTNAVTLVEDALDRVGSQTIRTVGLYTPGSALDRDEIAPDMLITIIRRVMERARPNTIVVETRPELVNEGYLSDVAAAAGQAVLKVCLPLESASPTVRRVLGKGFANGEYERSAQIVHKVGALLLSTVLLKPPGLSEGQAITDAQQSIAWLSNRMPAEIVLEPMIVYAGTRVAELWAKGEYSPPWLWSIGAALEGADSRMVCVGGQFIYPPPLSLPRNCDRCTDRLWSAICGRPAADAMRRLNNEAICDCRRRWVECVSGCNGGGLA